MYPECDNEDDGETLWKHFCLVACKDYVVPRYEISFLFKYLGRTIHPLIGKTSARLTTSEESPSFFSSYIFVCLFQSYFGTVFVICSFVLFRNVWLLLFCCSWVKVQLTEMSPYIGLGTVTFMQGFAWSRYLEENRNLSLQSRTWKTISYAENSHNNNNSRRKSSFPDHLQHRMRWSFPGGRKSWKIWKNCEVRDWTEWSWYYIFVSSDHSSKRRWYQ